MVTSSKRTYALSTPRAPVPETDHCQPVPPQETLKHASVSVSVGSLVHTRFVWALRESMAGTGFNSKCEFMSPTILLGLLLCPWMWSISSQPFQCLPSYWGFLTLGVGYLLIAAAPDFGRGISPLSCSSARQPVYVNTGYINTIKINL